MLEDRPWQELADGVLVRRHARLDLNIGLVVGGERCTRAELRHLGRGHTDNDVVVQVQGGVTFAGDLVEEGAPPAFGDAFPLDWPGTLEQLLERIDGPVVPGHGAVVDRAFVVEQTAVLASVAAVAVEAFADGREPGDAASALDLPTEVAAVAIERAFRQLRGEPPYDPPERIREQLGLHGHPPPPAG
jgi:hypothetical protein